MMTEDALIEAVDDIRMGEDTLSSNERIIALVRANTKPQALTCTRRDVEDFTRTDWPQNFIEWLEDKGAVFAKPRLLLRDVQPPPIPMTHRIVSTGQEFAHISGMLLCPDGVLRTCLSDDAEVEPIEVQHG